MKNSYAPATVRAAFVALVGVACALPANAGYRFTSIDFPGVDYSNGGFVSANAINRWGQIVGCEGINTADHGYCFVFDDRKKQFSLLPPYETTPTLHTVAMGINDAGVVVGLITDTADDSYFEKGFILDKGVFTIFAHPGSLTTEPRAINDEGLVTGWSATSAGIPPTSGFLYDPKTGSFDDYLSSDGYTLAQGIDHRRDIVGSAFQAPDQVFPGSPIGYYGFHRSPNGSVTLFRVNGGSTKARGINDKGLIAGYVTLNGQAFGFVVRLDDQDETPGFDPKHRVRYQDVTVKDSELMSFPGSVGTYPEAISDSGVIVGLWVTTDGSPEHAFVAKPAEGCGDERQ